jgi:hypothetical protein
LGSQSCGRTWTNCTIKSLTESIDTITTGGKLIFYIFGALAEFENNLVKGSHLCGCGAATSPARRSSSAASKKRRCGQLRRCPPLRARDRFLDGISALAQ